MKEYDKVYLPSEGNTALFYLFFSQDFSPEYSSRFMTDAHIDTVGNIRFIQATCPTEVLSEADRKEKILVVNRHSCAEPEEYEHIDTVTGKNILLGFKVYRTASDR